MLHSKQDFINCLNRIIDPLADYYTPGRAGIKCGWSGSAYTDKTALLEAFARVLWGLGPLWGGGNSGKLDPLVLEGLINGTDPNHPEYWGPIPDIQQPLVEAAPFGLALALAPQAVWEPLTDGQKQNFYNWLDQANHAEACENNWKFFAVLVNLGFKRVGMPYNKEVVQHGIDCFDEYYKGDGWYSDGHGNRMDYYIAFAMHFYTLIYAKLMEDEDPVNSKKYKERACQFAKDFIYWFAEDGGALCFGRSLTYRFAQCCFWSACVFADIRPFPIGVMKGIIARNLEWWMSLPIFDNGGILSVGYGYPNLNMAETYNAYGSPYWALKTFLILTLPDGHEFWSTDALPLPELDSLHPIPQALMTVQRFHGYPIALSAGQWLNWNPTHIAWKYSKFAYSSKYAFSVPRAVSTVREAGTDSMLAFDIDGHVYVREQCLDHRVEPDGSVWSRWSPFRGIEVETTLIPTADGHIRRHTVTCDEPCKAYDCSFAIPTASADRSAALDAEQPGTGSIEGPGKSFPFPCSPSTNLLHPKTFIKSVCYEFPKGSTTVETRVVYPD